MSTVANKKPVVLVSLAIACSLAADSMLYIVLPIYWLEAGLTSLWEVGILLSINRFIRLPLNPLIGYLYSKIEIRTGLFLATILAAGASLGYSLGANFWAWLLFRSFWGFAWALFSLGGLLTVLRSSDENNRGQMMGTYNGLYRLGSLVGMLLGGLLPGLIGFKKTAFFFVFLSFLSFVFVFLMNNVGEGEQIRTSRITAKTILLKPVLLVLSSGFIINMLYRGVINSTLSLIIVDSYGLQVEILGFLFGSTALAGGIQAARWFWEPFLASKIGQISDGRIGRIPLLIGSLFLAAFSFILATIKAPLGIWLGFILFVMLCATALTTLTDALATDVASKVDPISVMTSYIIANDIGAALGPLLIYQLITLKNGIMLGFWGSGIILIFLSFLWYKNRQLIY